ncbi:transmembrane protein 98-like [Harmonia axyridis]|uniref:transmembrane protein 98-like n=1 Tax=Harmonia axyridis TaxID=115357 RepID=UPI001E278DCF|nr:transmembrane protein 98-like [Harmonia axyridis]
MFEMPPEYSEMIAAVAIGVLSAIFISAFVILIMICRRQQHYKQSYADGEFSRPEIKLISNKSEVEIIDIDLSKSMDEILENKQWVGDATGLIPHCLSILKACRYLTERLTALAMDATHSKKALASIVENAKKISSRVDDMVQSMYPPLDPRLLEARAAALTLAVSHLVLVARYECDDKKRNFIWIDQSLQEINENLSVLRSAASLPETNNNYQAILHC